MALIQSFEEFVEQCKVLGLAFPLDPVWLAQARKELAWYEDHAPVAGDGESDRLDGERLLDEEPQCTTCQGYELQIKSLEEELVVKRQECDELGDSLGACALALKTARARITRLKNRSGT